MLYMILDRHVFCFERTPLVVIVVETDAFAQLFLSDELTYQLDKNYIPAEFLSKRLHVKQFNKKSNAGINCVQLAFRKLFLF